MRTIGPRIDGCLEVSLGEEQLEFITATAAIYPGPMGVEMVTRWTFTPDERKRIAAGEDLYVRSLTGGGLFQPIALSVGWDP